MSLSTIRQWDLQIFHYASRTRSSIYIWVMGQLLAIRVAGVSCYVANQCQVKRSVIMHRTTEKLAPKFQTVAICTFELSPGISVHVHTCTKLDRWIHCVKMKFSTSVFLTMIFDYSGHCIEIGIFYFCFFNEKVIFSLFPTL